MNGAGVRLGVVVLALTLTASAALGQSLYEQPAAPTGDRQGAGSAAAASNQPQTLDGVSLLAIQPPKPREFAENDLVTIIISERSKQDRNQKVDSKKEYDQDFAVTKFIDLISLLEAQIEATTDERLAAVAVGSKTDFKGNSKYVREDKITDRITARVLEIKPNGTMVLEARRSMTTDEEEAVVTLSGVCRSEDVTDANTVQSNQLFDLSLNVQNSGELKRTTRKGLIPRVLETLLNF